MTKLKNNDSGSIKHHRDYSRVKYGFGRKNNHVQTRVDVARTLHKFFRFDFDPCPYRCDKFDGLRVTWGKRNFVNPPYSSIRKWIVKALEERRLHKSLSVFLIPVRTGSRYWHTLILPNARRIYFLPRGVYFQGYDKPAPFDLCLVLI